MDAPTISLWVQLKITSHWSIVICFSQQVFYLEIACLNSFSPPFQVMNGLIISHNVKDHTNGSAPLRSLPVITFNSLYLTSTRMALLECKVIHYLIIVQISALKQNGLLQTLAAGGDQPKPAGNSHILSHGCFSVSHPLPPGICECILDTRRLLQVKPPSGVQIAQGLSGGDAAGLFDWKDLWLRMNRMGVGLRTIAHWLSRYLYLISASYDVCVYESVGHSWVH